MSNQDSDKTFVYVEFYVMLGDDDDSIEGAVVATRKKWEKELARFKRILEDAGLTETEEREYKNWPYTVSPENWTVQYATAEEAKVLKKFLGEDYGFRWPSEFVD